MPKPEIVHKLTESQIKDNQLEEIVGQVVKLEEDMLELRGMMIEIRKELIKINKKNK